jgi:glycosyltransferase involved in cell wall biosynthesis
MPNPLKIAFLTSSNPANKTAWSGIHYQMFEAIKKQEPQTIALGPVWDKLPRALIYLFNNTAWILGKKRYNKAQNLLLSFWYAIFFQMKLRNKKFNLIFAPTSSAQIAFIKTKIPIYCYGDTSFSQINGYYPEFSNLISFSKWESEYIEKRALTKANVRIYASNWAANHAISHYKIEKSSTYVVPLGANVLNFDIPKFNEKKLEDTVCRLLFIGVDWERKGGPLAFETFQYLTNKGFETELTVVGCVPPMMHAKLRVIPFLDKNLKEDYQLFVNLFQESHFLLMPSRAECAGIVYAEASAFYVPSLAADTGGVESMIENGVNGFRLNINAGAEEYALLIENYFIDKERYRKFAFHANEKYKNELNWTHWANQIMNIIAKNR